MKRPTMLLECLLAEASRVLQVPVERDVAEIRHRFEHEGMSFLTLLLPSLDDALLRGLTQGRITPSDFPGFKPWRRSGKLPALLSGFFMRVFDSEGELKATPCIESIRLIRQVTRSYKKVLLPCSKDRRKAAYERYVTNDSSVFTDYDSDVFCHAKHYARVCRHIWAHLEELSGVLYCAPGTFGNGATAEKLKLNERYAIRQWPQRSDWIFPAAAFVSNREDDTESLDSVEFLAEDDEPPVRVVEVPKTLKAPRIISIEPSYMMLMQKSIAVPLMGALESGYFGFKSIRFTDQTVNQKMARSGSLSGRLATIDLSDASDLVSMALVRKTFQTAPTFLSLIEGCRSQRAILPTGELVTLRKFASMGSAMCFPVEAMVFFSIVLTAVLAHHGYEDGSKLSLELIRKHSRTISVYGDDIIVPTETAQTVMDYLEAFGLRVNHEKSFTTGFFRESCGGDYYKGECVTPAYVRRLGRSGNDSIASWLAASVSLSNQLYVKGFWNASQFIRDEVDSHCGYSLPRTTSAVGALTYRSVSFNTNLRWDASRCSYRVRAPLLRTTEQSDPITDLRSGLLRFFLPRAQRLFVDDLFGGEPVGRERKPSTVPFLLESDSSRTHSGRFDLLPDPSEPVRDASVTASNECWLGQFTTVRPHALRTKRGWAPVNTGVPGW